MMGMFSFVKKKSLLWKKHDFCYNYNIKGKGIRMKKFTSFLSILSWLALLGFLGLKLYQVDFAFTSVLDSLQTTYQGGVLYLLDFSSIDLNYGLYAFAVLLYSLSLLLAFFKLLFQGRLVVALSFLIHLTLTLVLLLAVLNDPSLLTGLLNDVQSTSLLVQLQAITLLGFIGLAILSFLVLLLSFIRQPVISSGSPKVIEQEDDLLANELKRFVVPNQVSVQVPPVVNMAPSPVAMLQPQPVVQTPPLDTNRRIDELKARETVHQIKEKIRVIIRAQLAQLPPPSSEASPVQNTGSPTPSVVSEDMVRKLVTELFQQEFNRLLQQQKEELSSLINEELIKYDALNREVIETMINEKIEHHTVQALQHVEQTSSTPSQAGLSKNESYVSKDELASALASLQPTQNQEDAIRAVVLSVLSEQSTPLTSLDTQDVQKDEIATQHTDTLESKDVENVEQPPSRVDLTQPVDTLSPESSSEEPTSSMVNQINESEGEIPVNEPSKPIDEPLIVTPEVATEPIKKAKTKQPKVEVEPSSQPSLNISPEDQFKSVLPANSKVTRTGKKKIIRVSFQKRMAKASLEQRQHYDELKNYLLSYRVKSRVSSVGDMFRLHKEEYVKIAIAGKGLKLYMALDPKDYENSTIPVDDASDKKMYQNIPLVFRVKSDLSLKRAKVLIDDLMLKKNLPQKEVLDLPWSKQFTK